MSLTVHWGWGWWWLAVSALAAVAVYLVRDVRYRKGRQTLPGPVPLPLFGNVLLASKHWRRRHWFFLELSKKYGAFNLWFFKHRMIIITEPDLVDYVLNRNFKNYERGDRRRANFKELLGDGIFTADGREWMLHRKLAKPLFRSAFIAKGMVPVFHKHIHHVLAAIGDAANAGTPLDIFKLFMSFTMATFLELGLGCKEGSLSEKQRMKFQNCFDRAQEEFVRRIFSPLSAPIATRNINRYVKYLDKHVYRIINERKKESLEELQGKHDIFSQFLALTDDNGQPLSDKYLRDVFLNFLLAGRDTTATALTWTFYNLSLNPEVEAKLYQEVQEVVHGDVPTMDEIQQLTYAKNVFTETLRLYPSVPFDGRTAVEDDVLPNGVKIFAGDEVVYGPFSTGRLAYEDEAKFDPDRWLEERAQDYHKALFSAFHLGPQTCLGKEMAYTEAVQTLSAIVKQYQLRLVPGEETKTFTSSIILTPANGMLMTVQQRCCSQK